MLFIVIGLPGTGKSEISKILAEKYNAIILNTDEARNFLFKLDQTKKDQVYPKEMQDLPYRALFFTAKKLIQKEINVIIDAALYSNVLIKEARSISKKTKTIQIICPEEIVKERLLRRVDTSGEKYSAGIRVYNYMKDKTEKIKKVDFIIDTSKDIDEQIRGI